MNKPFQSFGRATQPTMRGVSVGEAKGMISSSDFGPGAFLAYGNGRSYGDTCQNAAQAVIDMRSMNRILSFDPETGLMRAEAGVMLSDIIERAAPHGWFPAVVPGTRFVTLGGAIANDVHGKNHHSRGTFGCHVESFTLLRSDGSQCECRPAENDTLFRSTIGGMGLTGLILEATIQLMKVGCADVDECVSAFSSLKEYFDLAEEADAQNEYAVAWIDQLASGKHAGRGLLMTANHSRTGSFKPAGQARLSVPVQPPFNVLNGASIRLFNRVYRWSKGRKIGVHRTHYASYFFPLDGVRHWNRLYGPEGLYQHQSVVPLDAAREVIPSLLAAAREAGQASFLTVLKRFGDVRSPGVMSFPRTGYTLTLDFPNRCMKTRQLLDRLDEITIDAGGAVNPYKDARMGAKTFEASFPNWWDLERQRDPAFMSDFWRRTAMVLQPSCNTDQAAE